MPIDQWTTRQRWIYAIKPGSWPKLLVPFVLGQMLGVWVAGGVNLAAVALGFVFTVLDGLFIVLMNDWGDQKVDRIKREMFPDGCSPKTIPDGVLGSREVLVAGLLAAAAAAGVGFAAEDVLNRPGAGLAALAALGMFAAYSLPPFKLNYRGGGELLEAGGVGVVLPLFNAYLQSGKVWDSGYEILAGTALMALASALASGLSDEESDRAGGKTTFTTLMGNQAVRAAVLFAMRLGVVAWLVAAWRTDVTLLGAACAAVVCALHLGRMRARDHAAVTNEFGELKRYKMHLHHAIWYGSLTLTAALLTQYLLETA